MSTTAEMEPKVSSVTDEDAVSRGDVQVASIKSDDTPEEPQFNPDYRFYLAFLTLCVVTLAAALDATSLSVALPIIAADLGMLNALRGLPHFFHYLKSRC